MPYLPRIVDTELSSMLAGLAAVAIDGPKGVGKTATATRHAATTIALDNPDELALLSADRRRITRLPHPLLLDEWQRYPPIWDAVRRGVDSDPSPGQFILTGSASPGAVSTHSGAGRIVRLRMRPLSFAERGLVSPTVSLAALAIGDRPEVSGESPLTLLDYAEEITRSGFPAIRQLSEPYLGDTLDGYLTGIVEHDFAELGQVVRKPATLRAWLTAYSAATATVTSYETIAKAATPGNAMKPAKETTQSYRDILARLWLLDPVPGWAPTGNRFNRLGQSPKHHLADPALAARLLGATPRSLLERADLGPPALRDGPLLGALFESLATLSVRAYAQPSRFEVHHLRTHRGEHEIDLVLTSNTGDVVAFEVKLSSTVDDYDVRHLHWLREKLGSKLVEAAVITTGTVAYRRSDGVAVIPLALLGS